MNTVRKLWKRLPFNFRFLIWKLKQHVKNPRNFLRLCWRKLPFRIRNSIFSRRIIQFLANLRSSILSLRFHIINKRVLQDILVNNKKKILLFYPTYDWKIPLHQRPQHFASELARAGYLVFFCTQNIYDDVAGYEEIETDLYLTNQYKTLLKHADVVIGYATDPNFSLRNLRKILKSVDCFVYDYLDEMHIDLNGRETRDLRARHAEAIAHPKTIVSVSAKSLEAKVRLLKPESNVLYLPNACNFQHFENSINNETKQITIGYFGAIASWFDFELILKVAQSFGECRIKLIGQDYDGSISKYDLSSTSNIDLLPPIDYLKLPSEAKFDIGILPFRVNAITLATSPIKIFEYLAMGLPVVSIDLPECREIPGVLIAANHAEFVEQIRVAITQLDNPIYVNSRKDYAKTQTWEGRVKSLVSVIDSRNQRLP